MDNFLLGIAGHGEAGLGKVALRLEFPSNAEMFEYIDTNRQLHQFVKPPNAKNPKDPETQKRLKQIAEKAKLEPTAEPIHQEKDPGIKLIPLNEIFTDHANFQNRESEFSAESVERILSAIHESAFSWAVFDPITLYRNPKDNRYYVLSGHSRFEAFKRASKAGLQAESRSFDKIPARIFEGTLEAAKQLARTSNNLSTKETDVERANYYRQKRLEGTSEKILKAEAQKYEGKNATFILNLSYLNPTGKAWESLKLITQGTESENSRTIKELADWVGEARRRFPQLTNSHENEIFDWLYSGAFSKLKIKRAYLERLGMAIAKATQFGVMDERLNIENRSGKSATELEYDEKVADARLEYDQAEKELREKRKEFIARGADLEKLDQYLLEYQARVNNTLRRLNDLVKLRDAVKEGARNQMSLFGLGSIAQFNFLGVIGSHFGFQGLGNVQDAFHFHSTDIYYPKLELDKMNKLKISKSEIEEIFDSKTKSYFQEINKKYSPLHFAVTGWSSKKRFIGFYIVVDSFQGVPKLVFGDPYFMEFSQIANEINLMT